MSKEGEHSVFFENEAAETPSAPAPAVHLSNLELVHDCDNFPYYITNPSAYAAYTESFYHLLVPDHIQSLGLVRPWVAEILRGLSDWEVDDSLHTLTLTTGTDRATRSAAVAATTAAMRATGHFAVLDKWRDELYPVFGEKGDVLFDMERSATPLFGVVTYGAHLTAFVRAPAADGGPDALRVWVARRSRSKQTYAGMLDNAAAGGIAAGETPRTSMVRECAEEASLPAALVEPRLRAVGVVSYFHVRDQRAGGETGLMQPECEYAYDLELDADVVPKPNDDEVESFELLGAAEVQARLARGEFKPNCALILLDFFIRHGLITPEGEPHYTEIVSRLHRLLEFPTGRF